MSRKWGKGPVLLASLHDEGTDNAENPAFAGREEERGNFLNWYSGMPVLPSFHNMEWISFLYLFWKPEIARTVAG